MSTSRQQIPPFESLLRQGRVREAIRTISHGIVDNATQRRIANRLLDESAGLLQSLDSGACLELFQLVTGFADDQNAAEAHYRRSVIFRREGDGASAVREAVLSLVRADHMIAFEIIGSFQRQEELDALREHLPLLEEVAEATKERMPYFYVTISDALVLLGDYDRSARYISRARDLECHWDQTARQLSTTSPVGRKPATLIIGAMKCGTTMLFDSMLGHPGIGRTVRKEINYFENPNAGFDWYLNHFARHELAGEMVSIDASATYYAREIHDRLESQLPEARFIMIVRDPARRAISHYFHVARHGGSHMPVREYFHLDFFHDLLEKSDDAIESSLFDICMGRSPGNVTVSLGFYYYFLRRWLRHFSPDRFLFLTLQDLHKHPHRTLQSVFRFIEVDENVDVHLADPYAGSYELDCADIRHVQGELDELYASSKARFEKTFGLSIGSL